jgi:hypothetical protein
MLSIKEPQMKFKVSGQNKDNGSKMTLEIEAASKGEAERRAASTGMYVTHVEPLESAVDSYHRKSHDKRSSGFVGSLIRLAIFAVIIAVIAYFGWPYIRQILGRA